MRRSGALIAAGTLIALTAGCVALSEPAPGSGAEGGPAEEGLEQNGQIIGEEAPGEREGAETPWELAEWETSTNSELRRDLGVPDDFTWSYEYSPPGSDMPLSGQLGAAAVEDDGVVVPVRNAEGGGEVANRLVRLNSGSGEVEWQTPFAEIFPDLAEDEVIMANAGGTYYYLVDVTAVNEAGVVILNFRGPYDEDYTSYPVTMLDAEDGSVISHITLNSPVEVVAYGDQALLFPNSGDGQLSLRDARDLEEERWSTGVTSAEERRPFLTATRDLGDVVGMYDAGPDGESQTSWYSLEDGAGIDLLQETPGVSYDIVSGYVFRSEARGSGLSALSRLDAEGEEAWTQEVYGYHSDGLNLFLHDSPGTPDHDDIEHFDGVQRADPLTGETLWTDPAAVTSYYLHSVRDGLPHRNRRRGVDLRLCRGQVAR